MSIINQSILFLITVIHVIILLFVIIAPFSGSNCLRTLHIIVIPFILFHWYVNDNTCALTVAEKFIREKTYGQEVNKEECFSYKFIAPIYDFNKNYDEYSNFTYTAMIALWSVSIFNMTNEYYRGNIKSIKDLTMP